MSRGKRSLLHDDLSIKRLLNHRILTAQRIRIVSYQRSGRTWLRLMLHDVSADPKFIHAGPAKKPRRNPENICQGIEKYYKNRIVFLHRDPRDVVVSNFHHYRRKGIWDDSLSSFIRDPHNGFERILAFNIGWMEASANFADFFAIGYEDLRAEPYKGLKRIVEFMRCVLVRDAAIERAIANNTFRSMKRREQSGELHARFGNRFTPGGDIEDNMMYVRRGIIGGHTDEFDAADSALCEELLNQYDYFARFDTLVAKTVPDTVSPQ